MRSRRPRLLSSTLIAAASALLLAGCTAAPVLTPVASSPEPAPSPAAPVVEVVKAPVPFLDIACADMITEEELYAALGATVTPVAANNTLWDGSIRPTSFALESLGGIHCQWDNGQPQSRRTELGFENNPTFIGVSVRVMPNAVDEWRIFSEYYTEPGEGNFDCYNNGDLGDQFYCSADELQGSNWAELALTGPPLAPGSDIDRATATTRAMWDAALARVAAAPPSADLYVPPSDVIPLDMSCDQFVTREQAQQVLGLTAPPYLDSTDGGWSLQYSALRLATSFSCFWVRPDPLEPTYATFDGVGVHNFYLLGGEWAFDRLREKTPANYEEVDIAELGADDSAYIDCARSEECILHLVIGHNWITFEAVETDYPGAVPVDRRALIRLGELTAATLLG